MQYILLQSCTYVYTALQYYSWCIQLFIYIESLLLLHVRMYIYIAMQYDGVYNCLHLYYYYMYICMYSNAIYFMQ